MYGSNLIYVWLKLNLRMAQNKFGPVQKLPKKWPQKCEYDMAILQNFPFTPWDNYREFTVN